MPQQIRVSLGTAIVLGLTSGKLDAAPTTAYLMTYKRGKCAANCSFCPQARGSRSSTELLARVSWPTFPVADVTAALTQAGGGGAIKRVCIQALNYPDVFVHLGALVREIKGLVPVPVSVSCQPLNRENIVRLAAAGVDRLGIALDAATEKVFDSVKGKAAGGGYSWDSQFRLLGEALDVFGKGNVSTHLIVGLGETERDAVQVIQRCVDMGVLPALFAFTPVPGTALEKEAPPVLEVYRRIQLARYLIVNSSAKAEDMTFDGESRLVGFGVKKQALTRAVKSGEPFRTSGCLGCNRPFYNEKPSGPIYNYPYKPKKQDVEKIRRQLGGF